MEQEPRSTQPADALAPADLPLGAAQRQPVNARSVLLGLLGVIFIAGVTPYNNYVFNNTDLVGNFLPAGLLLYLLALILMNGVLRLLGSRRFLAAGELAVIIGMTLVASALPAGGLMRYLPGHLVGYHDAATTSDDARQVLIKLKQDGLPDWIFPTFSATDPAERGQEDVIRHFMTRVPGERQSLADRWGAVPWALWARPALTWGLFLGAMFGAVLCMMVVFRRQWVENERLPFPIATVYLSLIEEPAPGKAFNTMLRSRAFWIAFAVVFLLHGFYGLSRYLPKYVPEIPLRYDLQSLFAEEPWKFTHANFKAHKLYFTVIGMTYFIQARLAFSLWAFFLLSQVERMIMGSYQHEMSGGMENDRFLGSMLPYLVALLYVARHQLALVVRQMLRGPREGEPHGRYLPYRVAGWGFLLCTATMVGWLWYAGATFIGAVVLVAMLMAIFCVFTRIIAETGLLYLMITPLLNRPWIYALQNGAGVRTNLPTYLYGQMLGGSLAHDMRQSLTVYAGHALRIADGAAYEADRTWRRGIKFMGSLVMALVVAYLVSGASMMYVEYSYAASLDKAGGQPINSWGTYSQPRTWGVDAVRQYAPPNNGPTESHSRALHFGVGAGVTAALSFLRLRYASWPLHPLGFMMCYSQGLRMTWFSIFLGWSAKVLVVRFGGGQAFTKARSFFLGLILGEAVAVAFWLAFNFIRGWLGMSFEMIQILLT